MKYILSFIIAAAFYLIVEIAAQVVGIVSDHKTVQSPSQCVRDYRIVHDNDNFKTVNIKFTCNVHFSYSILR